MFNPIKGKVAKRQKNPHKHLGDHILLKLLLDKGFSRESLSKSLGVSTPYLTKAMKYPSIHFSVAQLVIIAGLLNKPIYEVIGLVIGYKAGRAKGWYEE